MKRFILILALSLAALLPARAQMQLTLEGAVEMALSENPTIVIAQMEIARYDYVKRQTWGSLLPQVNISGRLNHTFIQQNMAKGFSLGSGQYNDISAAVDATMPLFAPQVYRTLKLNDVQMATAVEAARASRITLVAEVKKAFYNTLLAQQSLKVLLESESTAATTVADTKLKYDNGLASEYDLLTAQVQLSNLRPTILQTQTSITLSKRLLKMHLSIPEDITIELTGDLDSLREQVLVGTDGLTTDVEQNSDLRTLELQEQLLNRQLKLANASRLPTIGLFSNFTYTGNDRGSVNFATQTVIRDGFYWQNPLSAGVQMSIPLFAGLTKMNRSRELKNQIGQISIQREYATRQIDVQVRSSLNDLLTAREKMNAQALTVEQASKAYAIANTRYGAGAGTILELNSAQLARTQAQLNYSQTIFDYLTAKAEYDRIAGRDK